ncbi:DUF447 domain-containing protein [Planctomicrobium sp. SH664]|uniref:DUF447 domain-containing protein n=1 Tax=Planctomicrobium sp. SH664 TaxID=3448125 RepID=UPI003F5C25F9
MPAVWVTLMVIPTMILEGLCTTRNTEGKINIAPMGPIVDEELKTFRFRPYQSSTTFANLQATRCGVFHVTDDMLMIAQAAIGRWIQYPKLFPALEIEGAVIADACRWYEFTVTSIDDSEIRSEVITTVRHAGKLRDFFGMNRAKSAVLETAIMATRLHLLPHPEIRKQMEQFAVIVDKTAGERDRAAFELLREYLERRLIDDASSSPEER